jgi:aryl-alcohol dehydrogenase-like predicted oxidoreductase
VTAKRSGFDRREFLRLGAATSGLAVACGRRAGETRPTGEAAEMRYRTLGATGLRVSEIAFGAHGVDNPPLMEAAWEAGINTFCTSGHYLDGLEEEALGKAIRAASVDRDQLVVLTGNRVRPGITKRSVLADIDASLRRLGTDRIEIYYVSDVRSPAELRVDAFHEAIEEARQAGKVGHLGLSGHSGGMQDVLNTAIDDGRFEVFFIKFDFVSYPDQDEILYRAAQQGIGNIVFKTNAGNRRREIKDLESGGLSYPQATVRWALTQPVVASVAITLTSFAQIREMAAAVGRRPTRSEAAMLRHYADEMRDRYCRFCADCESSCPHGVAIADINRYWMYFAHYDRRREARQHYAALPWRRSAAACEECAAPCNSACPFHRPVRAELVEAHRRLRGATA